MYVHSIGIQKLMNNKSYEQEVRKNKHTRKQISSKIEQQERLKKYKAHYELDRLAVWSPTRG